MTGTVAIVSGGMDSVVLAHYYADRYPHEDLTLVWVDYGQRHKREGQFSFETAERLGAAWIAVDLSSVGALLTSSLTDSSIPVPEGHYADESMRATVVPNRNAILLNVAVGLAVVHKAARVGTGVHAGDHPVYPDCRPEFITEMSKLARVANAGFIDPGFVVEAPFVNMGKHDIVVLGDDLLVPFDRTWSCYVGGSRHCGRCGTCVERREAFELAGVTDPTVYEEATV